jgi:hypothetical protein
MQICHPDPLSCFYELEVNIAHAHRVPAVFSQDMITLKKAAQRAFRKYFDLPTSEHEGACWMVNKVEAEMRNTGISTADISTFLLMMY